VPGCLRKPVVNRLFCARLYDLPWWKIRPSAVPPGEASPMLVIPEQFDELDDVEKQKARGELKAAKRYRGNIMLTEKLSPTLHRHRTETELLSLCTRPLYLASWM